jgi:ornithine cyclodeaminase/alanine dehydrogenase-like protein (mu-crystallin family)
MSNPLILSNDQISEILTITDCIEIIENLFKEYYDLEHCDLIQMPPKVYLNIPHGDFRAMPALVKNTAGIKWCGVHLDGTGTKRKVNIFAKVLINDVDTGELLAIMDGEVITAIRTAAVTAVATKYMSRPNATVGAFVGCGTQTRSQIEAVLRVRDLSRIHLFDLSHERAQTLASRFPDKDMCVCESLEECLYEADIVTTLTPSRKGFIRHEWLKPVVHINAIGADAKGKRELEASVLNGVDLVAYDEWTQCSHSGEIQYSHEIDSNARHLQTWCPLSHIAGGEVNPSEHKQTLFDATGLAIEDIVTARFIYEKYLDRH